jgi:3-deoxy-D-manno-octulosonic acid kinase
VDFDRGAYRVIAPRLELDEMVALLTGPQRDAGGHDAATGGRGSTQRLALPGGKTVYVRKYVHGGLVGRFVRDVYLLRPERPVRELIVTETARAAGCPVPHVLAVCIEEAVIGYRGWLVTQAIEDARPLIDVLAERASELRPALLARIGAAIRALHSAGVYHVDLTGHNVLVGPGDRVSFVDFDRAYLAAPGSARHEEAARGRLWRSLGKLSNQRGLGLPAEGVRWLGNARGVSSEPAGGEHREPARPRNGLARERS